MKPPKFRGGLNPLSQIPVAPKGRPHQAVLGTIPKLGVEPRCRGAKA